MQLTVGNLMKSTFQRYKVRMNPSLEGKVMTLGSRGVRAIFSAKIPTKRGKPPANQELRLVAGVSVFLTHQSS